jgi:quercetin dioxygenase-like cupin family protein
MPTQTQLIHSSSEPFFNIFGPVVQFLVAPADVSGAFALMRSIIAAGVAIPLHSHADPEVVYVIEGVMDVLQYSGDSSRWLTAGPGDTIRIPGQVKHALRNSSSASATLLLTITPNIYGFFRKLGKPFHPGDPMRPPTPQDVQRLIALAAKNNYWLASPQENAAIGLTGFSRVTQRRDLPAPSIDARLNASTRFVHGDNHSSIRQGEAHPIYSLGALVKGDLSMMRLTHTRELKAEHSVLQYLDPLYRYALALSRNHADAEDLCRRPISGLCALSIGYGLIVS